MIKNLETEHFDLICIGSGMGSLTVASLLAQHADKKVLILEKHFQPGGYTHSFQRKRGLYHWDVGIHYVGDMQEGGFCRQLMDTITDRKVVWNKMSEPFEKFVYPKRTFDLYGDAKRFQSDLISQFPDEESSIHQYFEDIRKASALFGKSMMLKASAPSLKAMNAQMIEKSIYTLKDYLDFHFKSIELKGILASQWGDYGLPPSKCNFATHASLVVHYLNGGYYPVGGAGKIFDSVEPLLEAKGGAVLSSVEVLEIIIQDEKAIGVKTRALRGELLERNFYAPIIVSGAGALPTFTKFIPSGVNIPFLDQLKDFYKKQKMTTSVCVYMGLKESPAKFGFRGENHWVFASNDHEENFAGRNAWLQDGQNAEIKNLYMSFPSLKDPEAKSHTADFITFTDYENFAKWKDLPWKKRGEDYAALKAKISDSVLRKLEQMYPGFSEIVDYIEVSTPITNEHFTSHPDGAIYGLACVPDRYDKEKSPWFEVKTPIEGLLLTGADAGGSPGIAGAMMGGLATVLIIQGNREILKKILK
ncbi:MAG: NAD(P)/FAD-dependent oxidoreductase [Leptospiraceae bacterium]|nr:NAD(P)/FAD-dependent oxidoreductase [Leptospiraceae bacterium]